MSLLFLRRVHRSDYLLLAGYWGVATLVILPTYVRQVGWERASGAMLYNILLDTATVGVVALGLLPLALRRRSVPLALGLGLTALLLGGIAYQVGYGWLLGTPSSWTVTALLYSVVGHTQSYGVLGALVVGKRYFDGQHALLRAQKTGADSQRAQAQSELRALQAQLDPHFLFNNLNVLHALIEQNPAEARHFLSCFSSLYRYLLRHQSAELVPLDEELRFADEYIYLLGHRFGGAYEFVRTGWPAPSEAAGRFLVPGTLQVLLENVVKHNRGGEETPLVVTLAVDAHSLTVRHRRAPKHTPVDSLGTGLPNLRQRYRLLAGQEPLVQAEADFFTVTVPVLHPHLSPAGPASL